jgi:DNA mismatch repair protein MutL
MANVAVVKGGDGSAEYAGRIRLLDPHTINQIAAGEVVERPASAVKELVENAVDAGATRILVRLVDVGRSRIEISDDGCGMSEADARACLQRHATSKIRRVDDLMAVASYGFRGEALPSIASVARMHLSTGEEDGLRTEITVDMGQMSASRSASGPRGTRITVEELFGNVPARLKFLKSDATELAAITEAVSKAAIARPDIAFTLEHAPHADAAYGRLLATSGSGDLVTTVAEIWGREVARALVPIDFFNGSARVRGLVSPPHFTKPNRAMQWCFVNGRPIRNRTVQAALDQAFRSLTPEKRYPVAVLLLDVDPAGLDVNVSPTKSEVKFHQDGAVFDVIRRGVTQALLEHGMVPSATDVARADAALRAAQPGMYGGVPGDQLGHAPGHGAGMSADWAAVMALQSPLGVGDGIAHYAEPAAHGAEPGPGLASEAPTRRFERLLDGLRILGQIDDTLIIAENREALLVIDQHVAHERILFERLRELRGGPGMERQPLLEPETLNVGKRTAALVREKLADLSAVGFDLEPFGEDTFLLRTVPALLRGRPARAILQDMLDEIADGRAHGGFTPARDEVYTMCACKMAIKAGDKLGLAEMDRLVRDLADTENPYLCPHGRPITLVMPKGDLLRRFKR